MKPCKFSHRASLDLEEIVDYLGWDRPEAVEVVDAIESRCRSLASFPDTGRSREDLAPGLRSAVVAPYLIFYRGAIDHIEIIRILHGRRDIRAIFRKRAR